MLKYPRDQYFHNQLEILYSLKNKKDIEKKLKELIDYVVLTNNPFLSYRVALEAYRTNISTKKLENIVIKHKIPELLYRFSRDVDNFNIRKIENALIFTNDLYHISKFGCFIPGADKKRIEDIISKSYNAKAAYLFIRYAEECDVNKLKHIIYRSKRPRYLFELAKMLNNKDDIKIIEKLILNSKSELYVRLMAKYIKGVDVSKCEDRIIKSMDETEMRKFARDLPNNSNKIRKLISLF